MTGFEERVLGFPSFRRLARGAAIVPLAMMASQLLATAQEAPADEPAAAEEGRSSLMFEKVTVTAQKRAQDQQDVGIAITALNGEQLDALGFTNAQDVAAFSPGVVSVQPNGEGSYSFAVRGVANNDLSTNVESPVAVYVDDVYISQMSATGFLLFDIDTVEVLRGPQGTLFGRNATGGLVHYQTVKPNDEEFSGFGKISYGEYDDMMIKGAVNLPLADGLSARLSAAQHTSTGYIENREHPEQNLNNNDDWAFRLQLLAEPTDDLSILLNIRQGGQEIRTGFFEYKSAVNGGGIYTPGVGNPLFNGYEDTDGDVWAGDYDTVGHNISDTEGYTATVQWDVGGWELTSITDYQTNFRDYIEDTDATPYRAYEYYQTNDAQQFSQEFRAAKTFGNLNVVVGGYYLDLESEDSTGGIAPYMYAGYDETLVDTVLLDPTLANGDRTPSESSTTSTSLFGQAEYQMDKFTFIGGLRYIMETKDFVSAREDVHFVKNATSGLDPRTTVIETYSTFDPEEKDFDMWSWRAQVNYEPHEDLLTYLSYNRGVKSGGFSQPPYDPTSALLLEPEQLSYEPEELDAYEIGAKWDVIPGSFRINSAVYYYDYGNYQAYTNFPGSLGSATVNAQATNKGAEVEIQATPFEGLTAQIGAGYADIEVTDVVGFEGMTLTSVNSPEWNVNGLIRYEFPVGNAGDLALQLDGQYMSEHYFGLDVTPATTEDGYTLFNAAATWTPADSNWDLRLSVENLFEEEYLVQTFDLSDWIGMIEEYYGKPRWVRAELSWKF